MPHIRRLLNVLRLEVGIVGEDLLERRTVRELVNDDRDRDPHAANARSPAHRLERILARLVRGALDESPTFFDWQATNRSEKLVRVVFGQPRQQEMRQLLESSELSREDLEAWTISLRPDVEPQLRAEDAKQWV